MPFVDVRLADVELEKPSPVPAGKYVFQLQPGASYRVNPNNSIEELNVRFDIVEGDLQGRPVFVNYPDPTAVSSKGKSLKWSAQALKKLEIALGTDSLAGEDTAAYLNRIASSAHSRIVADMIPGKFIREGETEPRVEFGIFTVSPAA